MVPPGAPNVSVPDTLPLLPGSVPPLGAGRAAPPAGGPTGTAAGSGDYFRSTGSVTLPPPPAGVRPMPGTTAPPLAGAAGGPGDYFAQDGNAALPPPPKNVAVPPSGVPPLTAAPAAGGAATGAGDFFKADGQVTLPPPPKRAGDPVWSPAATAPVPPLTGLPAPPAGTALPPLPPTLPPASGGQ
jgi:hypothetical protein